MTKAKDRRLRGMYKSARKENNTLRETLTCVRNIIENTERELEGVYAHLEATQRELEDKDTHAQNLQNRLILTTLKSEYLETLLSSKDNDDVFRYTFDFFTQNANPGAYFGVGVAANEEGTGLRIIGCFGIPSPDSQRFCTHLISPLIKKIIQNPQVLTDKPEEHPDKFDPSIGKYLPGISMLQVPFMPDPSKLIGGIYIYKKGEQPITEPEIAIASLFVRPAGIALLRNP